LFQILGYQPIHRNTITRRIKRLQRHHHSKLIEQLKTVETISVTTDFWSNRTNTAFLVLTAHYCTSDLNLKSKILTFSSFNHRHTAVQIARIIMFKLRNLHILHKVNRIVCDGAKNISNAIELMNIDCERIWCIAHRLHLVVTKGLALWPKKSKKQTDATKQGETKYTV
jgi:hypothetical protein